MSPRRALRSVLAFVASIVMCGSTQAQLFRTYLASDGADSNPCTLAAPCRLLPAALAAVADGGEIWMLDSANYNTATVAITKSVTILAIPGAVGSVVAAGGNAIEATTPGSRVTLRNLRIVPFAGGGGARGIHASGAAGLTVEDSVISGHLDGIAVVSQTSVRIANCIIRDNVNNGIELRAGANAEISGSRIIGNGLSGVFVFGAATPTNATISDSVLSENFFGLNVNAAVPLDTARASITRSTVSGNGGVGIRVLAENSAGAIVSAGGNMVTNNATGLSQSGTLAFLETLGNNIVRQNTTPTEGTITPVPPM